MKREDISFPSPAMMDVEQAKIIYDHLVKMPKKGRLLETGTGFGHSALFFASVKPEWIIYTVDGFGLFGTGRIYDRLSHDTVKRVLNYYSPAKNIVQILANTSTVPWELPLDVLYIDADHTFEGCMKDFNNYSYHVKRGGLIIFDDYSQPGFPENGVRRVVEKVVGYELLYTGIAAIMRKS